MPWNKIKQVWGPTDTAGSEVLCMGKKSHFERVTVKTLEFKTSSSLNNFLCSEMWDLQNLLFFELKARCRDL